MNREIKFRGKMLDIDDFIYGYYIHSELPNEIFEHKIYCSDVNRLTDVKEETVGQFTGLHDKNGKEIYEGDIVLYEDWEMAYEGGGNDSFINKGIIEYVECNCCFNVTERQTVELQDVLYKDNESLEVIGNIYDNPELLGGE